MGLLIAKFQTKCFLGPWVFGVSTNQLAAAVNRSKCDVLKWRHNEKIRTLKQPTLISIQFPYSHLSLLYAALIWPKGMPIPTYSQAVWVPYLLWPIRVGCAFRIVYDDAAMTEWFPWKIADRSESPNAKEGGTARRKDGYPGTAALDESSAWRE